MEKTQAAPIQVSDEELEGIMGAYDATDPYHLGMPPYLYSLCGQPNPGGESHARAGLGGRMCEPCRIQFVKAFGHAP